MMSYGKITATHHENAYNASNASHNRNLVITVAANDLTPIGVRPLTGIVLIMYNIRHYHTISHPTDDTKYIFPDRIIQNGQQKILKSKAEALFRALPIQTVSP